MAKTNNSTIMPAYLSFVTFRHFVETLHSTALPEHIDRSLMRSMSTGTQTQLLAALRFLGLIDAQGRVTEDMQRLHKAFGTESWTATLSNIVTAAYAGIVGTVDIKTVTDKRLHDVFKESTGLDMSVVERAVRFYLKALAETKTAYSPHLGMRKSRAPTKRTNGKSTQPGGGAPQPEKTGESENPAGMVPMPLYPPPRRVLIPIDLTEAECETIGAMIKAYAKSVSNSKN